jgi:hypothetical protein
MTTTTETTMMTTTKTMIVDKVGAALVAAHFGHLPFLLS